MARIFRATYVKMRTVKDRKGNVIYDVKNGKKVARRVPVLDKQGKKVLAESRKWYIEYRDEDGIVRRVPGFTDKKATEQGAAKLEREAARRETGLIDRHAEWRKRPLAEHVADWEKSLLAKGRSEPHARKHAAQVRFVLEACRVRFWPDVSASKVQAFVGEKMRDTGKKRGWSHRTANSYLQATKQFYGWMVKDDRAPVNPLAHLSRHNERTDRRKLRRALTEEECLLLLDTTDSGPERYSLTGPQRAIVYRVALGTGLRANEIRTLTPAVFDLDADPPTVTVKASYSKHRREDVQPVLPSLAQALRAHLEGVEATQAAFAMPDRTNLARMLRADLKAAGIAHRDEAGRTVDFHALRHTYISLMARAGVPPKVLMDLARHSDINLTMAYYSHTLVSDRAKALKALPDLTGKPATGQRKAATGTDDVTPSPVDSRPQNDKQNDKRDDKSPQVTGPCRIRTYDQGIMSPLLCR